MRKTLKPICILLIFICLTFALQSISLADDWPSTYLNEAENWVPKEAENGGVVSATQNIIGAILSVIRVVGYGVSIIMLTYVGIKYMSAAPNEKADFKKSATSFIVGAIILFASTSILGIIADFATKNITSTPSATTSTVETNHVDN